MSFFTDFNNTFSITIRDMLDEYPRFDDQAKGCSTGKHMTKADKDARRRRNKAQRKARKAGRK